MSRTLVVGDRHGFAEEIILAALEAERPTEILHCGQGETEAQVVLAAELLGIPVRQYEPDKVFRLGFPERVIAFHGFIDNSTYTRRMLSRARAERIPAMVFDGNDVWSA